MLKFWIPSILLWPFLSALSLGLFARILSQKGCMIISIICIFTNVILSIAWFINLLCFDQVLISITFGSWIQSGNLNINWEFMFDRLNTTMLLVVNIISLLVHLYSFEYMKQDPHLPRFLSFISLFTFFMIVLVTGDNLLILFLGWEGVGLCSYLLINFWFTRINANKSAMKALIINRIGDFGLMLGIAVLYYTVGSLDFAVIFSIAPIYFLKTIYVFGVKIYVGTLIGILLFIGAMGKSAQIGLHTWLPDAMEGPTPVSALIHAATMVTAGVFLIIKCSPLFEYVPIVLSLMVLTGAVTALFSATIGLVQNDIKKVIAYSTCSQLGYMIFVCGLSQYSASFFHLSNHAFFKALLFLSAGAIIHSLSNEQDMRKFGGLNIILPLTSMVIAIGSLALAGMPFLSGFYSKDLIIELASSQYTISGTVVYIVGILTAILTSVYSYRLFFLTFVTTTNISKALIGKIHESSQLIMSTLIILAVSSIFVGYFSRDFFVGLGTDFWGNTIFIHPKHNMQINSEFIPQIFKILPFCLSLLIVFVITFLYEFNINFNWIVMKKIHSLLSYKLYFDLFYNIFIAYPILRIAYTILYKAIDKGLLEIIGPSGFVIQFFWLSCNFKKLHSSRIYLYGHHILIFLILIFIYMDKWNY